MAATSQYGTQKMKAISANNYSKIENVQYVEFSSNEEKENAINQYFQDFDQPYRIESNVIGYLIDEETGDQLGFIEEHYIDSGSEDYYYTAVIHNNSLTGYKEQILNMIEDDSLILTEEQRSIVNVVKSGIEYDFIRSGKQGQTPNFDFTVSWLKCADFESLGFDVEELENLMKINELLEKWIVVYFDVNCDEYNRYRVTRRSNFQEMDFCKAHGDYGVQVDCNNAGCYSFNNTDSEIFDHFYDEASKMFDFNEDILDELELTHRGLYEMLIEQTGSVAYKIMKDFIPAWDDVIAFFKEWREQNETHTQVKGWTFHDSHNFKTIVCETQFGETDCTELDKEEQIEILKQMPQTAPHIEGTNNIQETEDYIFHFDLLDTNPWFCYVERK